MKRSCSIAAFTPLLLGACDHRWLDIIDGERAAKASATAPDARTMSR